MNEYVNADESECIKRQNEIRERANYSLALLGKAFVYRGSGRFLDICVEEGKEYLGKEKK